MRGGHGDARAPRRGTRGIGVLLCALAASGALGAAAEAPPERTLRGLAAELSRLPGLEARFREERHFAVLAEPLVNEGTLYFAPPRRLLWRVERPIPSALLLDDRELRLTADGRTRRLDLSSEPLARAFVDGFMLLLRGDVAGIESAYQVRLTATEAADGWRVELVPRADDVRRAIASLAIWGAGARPGGLAVRLPSDDEIRTRFLFVDAARSFGPGELEELFRAREP